MKAILRIFKYARQRIIFLSIKSKLLEIENETLKKQIIGLIESDGKTKQ